MNSLWSSIWFSQLSKEKVQNIPCTHTHGWSRARNGTSRLLSLAWFRDYLPPALSSSSKHPILSVAEGKLILELQRWKWPYGSLSNPCQGGTVWVELPTSGSVARFLNHWVKTGSRCSVCYLPPGLLHSLSWHLPVANLWGESRGRNGNITECISSSETTGSSFSVLSSIIQSFRLQHRERCV